jgi:hypothetical protein
MTATVAFGGALFPSSHTRYGPRERTSARRGRSPMLSRDHFDMSAYIFFS